MKFAGKSIYNIKKQNEYFFYDLSYLLTLMQSIISRGPVIAGSKTNLPLSVAKATTADLRPFIFMTLDSMA